MFVFAARDRTPALDRAAFEKAAARWRERGTEDYDLEISIEGDRVDRSLCSLQVRGGKVVRYEKDGREDSGDPSGAYNTIPGLLEVIDREILLATGPLVQGAPRGAVLRAEFDPEWGYPVVFKRIASHGQSRFVRVEKFTPLSR